MAHRVAPRYLSLAAIVQEGPIDPSIKEGARGKKRWDPALPPSASQRTREAASCTPISSAGVAFGGDAGGSSGAGEVRL